MFLPIDEQHIIIDDMPIGLFYGKAEVDPDGIIQTIWLTEAIHPIALGRREDPEPKAVVMHYRGFGAPARNFKHHLFDALSASLQETYRDRIDEYMAGAREAAALWAAA